LRFTSELLADVLAVLLISSGLHHLENDTVEVPKSHCFSKGTGYNQKIGTSFDAHENPTQFPRFKRHHQHFERHIPQYYFLQYIFRKNTRIRYPTEKSKEEQIRKEFQEKINKKLDEDIGNNIQEIWKNIETIMREGAQLLTEGKRKIGKSWFDEECNDVIIEREKARMKMINNNNIENKQQYEKLRKRAKNVCRKKKRQNIEQIKEIEDNYMKKKMREF
jgi:hypothetical protein